MTLSFTKQLRDAAMNCPDVLLRKMARDIADEIATSLSALAACPTTEGMRSLNAAWVRGVLIYQKVMPTPDVPPRSDAGEVEQERLAA